MKIQLTRIFCEIDDFYRTFERSLPKNLLATSQSVHFPWKVPPCTLSPSEMMTLLVAFHLSNYRTFKHFYQHVHQYWQAEFPGLVSYPRFVALQPYLLVPLCLYLNSRKGPITGIAFIDSTSLVVCHNRRIHSHRVFKDLAKRGKNSIGWFFGFKLHLIINDRGDLLAFKLTPANTDDRIPVPEMTRGMWGKLFGDKGYISQALFELLFKQNLQLITKIKKNMKNKRPRSKLQGIWWHPNRQRPLPQTQLIRRFLLFLVMKLLVGIIRLPLSFHVITDHIFTTMLAHGTHEISITPKLASPKLGLHRRNVFENVPRRKALNNLYNLFRTIRRHRLDQKMSVISINTNF